MATEGGDLWRNKHNEGGVDQTLFVEDSFTAEGIWHLHFPLKRLPCKLHKTPSDWALQTYKLLGKQLIQKMTNLKILMLHS